MSEFDYGAQAVRAATYLEHAQGAALVDDEAPLQECVTAVNEARKAWDGIQAILAKVQLQKMKTYARREEARAAYEDAWGAAAKSGRVGFVEYSSARERDAAVDVKVMTEKFALRKAEKEHGMVMGFIDVLRTYAGIADSIRREAEFRVRAVQVLSALER